MLLYYNFICNPILNFIYIFFYTSNLIRHYVHIFIYEEVTNITHIIDYQGIQPINKTDATTFTIPNSPNKAILVNIELKIPLKYSRNNRIELITTIGFKSVTNRSQLFVRIFRNDIDIFNTQVSIGSTDYKQYSVETFQTIDKNVSSGIHEYTLTVENLTSDASADVIGPLSFSGLAIGQVYNSY
ncbi:hypothetical protein BAHan_3087 [Bacillus anthracis]|nr:hypothetical protein [Bacillus anthracis]ACK90060.1 hypothetical protein BCAH820_2896 [Bacillus cereus AH820]ACP15605.1 hypothetical protein BAMEG_1706 [Bacillus anthracis str. CDC 684]ACQ48928.1 hypothetical protein BAA_2952 [Bacillus anthracis str. A0248]AFH84148.1 Hypothetical Protein H9401_2762 [Bacillus anthracis str. H9401]AHK38927.1 hypothetical protein BAPAT_2779 [Bacillus anthracis str. SVA11]EDR20684.1 hypothetical protein BAC_2924 [Bacillus anthracis str. A0488]EDR89619.1 hypot